MTTAAPDQRSWLARLGGRRQPRARLGLLAILKNERLNLREWVDHHRWQGVDRFFLIDNGSTDGGGELLAEERAAGVVEWYPRPRPHAQVNHYREVFRTAGIRRKVEWLAMADLDEFWYAPQGSLPEELARLEAVDLVYANWRIFGSAGHEAHPESLRRCLTLRHPELGPHVNTKWICRTDALRWPWQLKLHKVRGVSSERVVSDNQRFHLNHYVTQSLHYFTTVKMARGDATRASNDAVRTLEYFRAFDAPATLEDRTLPELMARAGVR